MRGISFDSGLITQHRARLNAHLSERDGEQRGAHLLTARDKRVELSLARLLADSSSESEEAIGLAGHGAHDGDDGVSCVARLLDSRGDFTDSLNRSDARATILLYDQAQNACILVRERAQSILFFTLIWIALVGGSLFGRVRRLRRLGAGWIAKIIPKLSLKLIE